MNFIQPIFVNQTDSILQGKLGLENASFPLTDICERIQKDIDVGVSDFLLFVTPNTKTDSPDWQFQAQVVNHSKCKFNKQINLAVDVCMCSTTLD